MYIDIPILYSNSNITRPIHCELDNSNLIYSKSLNSFLFQSPRFKLSITKFEYSFKSNVLFSETTGIGDVTKSAKKTADVQKVDVCCDEPVKGKKK